MSRRWTAISNVEPEALPRSACAYLLKEHDLRNRLWFGCFVRSGVGSDRCW